MKTLHRLILLILADLFAMAVAGFGQAEALAGDGPRLASRACARLNAAATKNGGQAKAQSAQEGAQQFAGMGDFKLQSGAVIRDFRLGYRTLGTLNAEKSNAVLWPTWLGGTTQDLLSTGNVGPGKTLDPGKYFAILVDAIGNGVSSSPSNSKAQPLMQFPPFTIRDMVEAEHRLVAEVFHLTHLHGVMGASMGGMQTFEWMLAYPDFVDAAIPIAGSPQSTSYDKLLWTVEIEALELDPGCDQGHPTGAVSGGMALAEEISELHLTSPAYREVHTAPGEFDAFLAGVKKRVKGKRGTACDWIRQREAIIGLDLPKEFGGTFEQLAARVHAKALVIVSPEDLMVNPAPAEEFAKKLGAPVIEMDSWCGHISPGCISLGSVVAQFFADPTSVHSTTLREPPSPR